MYCTVLYCTVLYKVMMTGSLVYPHRLQLEFAEEELTEVEWFASERVEEGEASANKKAKVEKEDALVWRSVGRGRLYTPTLQVYLRTLHIVHPYIINIYTPTLYTLFSVQYTPTLYTQYTPTLQDVQCRLKCITVQSALSEYLNNF